MLPYRKKLPHDVPSWVPDHSRYFITINCARRGVNLLARDPAASELLSSLQVYEQQERWYVFVMVLMPDHVHLIASFPSASVRRVCSAWKSYLAKRCAIEWQSDFFEHRLRDEAEFSEKFHYVLMNPVRRNLVQAWQDWPFKFVRGEW